MRNQLNDRFQQFMPNNDRNSTRQK